MGEILQRFRAATEIPNNRFYVSIWSAMKLTTHNWLICWLTKFNSRCHCLPKRKMHFVLILKTRPLRTGIDWPCCTCTVYTRRHRYECTIINFDSTEMGSKHIIFILLPANWMGEARSMEYRAILKMSSGKQAINRNEWMDASIIFIIIKSLS